MPMSHTARLFKELFRTAQGQRHEGQEVEIKDQKPLAIYRIWERGGHGKRAEREPITGLWGQSHQRGPGTEPLVRESGEKPPKAETLFAFRRLMQAANLPTFLRFRNAENHR